MTSSAYKQSLVSTVLSLFVFLTACSSPTTTTNPEPEDDVRLPQEGNYFWNEVLELSYWQEQNGAVQPSIIVNGEALPADAIEFFSGTGVRFSLRPQPSSSRHQRPKRADIEVQINGQTVAVNQGGNRATQTRLELQGEMNAQRLNVLLTCPNNNAAQIREKLTRLEEKFRVIDYFGDQQSLGSSNLGAPQHPLPLCLLVIEFTDSTTKRAWQRLNEHLSKLLTSRILAISPDYYMHSYDPGVPFFDSNCDGNSLLVSEAQSATAITEVQLPRILGKSNQTLSGQGVNIAIFDGGVARPTAFLAQSRLSALSRRFLESDYPNANARAQDIADDFDCDETNFRDGHGALVSHIVQELAPQSHTLALKVCNEEGLCDTASFTKALLYIRNQYQGMPDIDIINMSFGGEIRNNRVFEFLLADLLEHRSDILIVASLGNNVDDKAHYPAQYQNSYDNVVAVAAAKLDDNRNWSLASFNTTAALNSLRLSPIAAPGVAIQLDTAIGDSSGISGTSFSAPMVTATAALLLEASPNASSNQIIRNMRNSADTSQGFLFLQMP